ncbi:MAG: holo-ACP synthase [Gammaproteobacteria bacterium]|nr:holo-ACP synthase [Gammaproteobacteria bacterium]
MIIGIGVDLCEIDRIREAISRHGDHFAQRILATDERTEFDSLNQSMRPPFLAKRFAAKEAVAKALGAGIGRGFGFHDITITHDALGKPMVSLNSENQALKDALAYRIHLSISDERTHAVAFCTIED